MAGLKRRLLDTSKMLKGTSAAHQALARQHHQLQQDFDQLLALMIGLARESQERRFVGKPLKVSVDLVSRDRWHLETQVQGDTITITAVPTVGTTEQEQAGAGVAIQ